MKGYTSTARKDGRWWVVQCDQVPEALSQVARLDQAVEHQREAIAFVLDVAEDEVSVEVHPVLDEFLTELLARARRHRDEAARLAAESSEEFRAVAANLAYADFSLRDIGTIIGVSHQRAHQLVTGETPERRAPKASRAKRAPKRTKAAAVRKAPRRAPAVRS